MSALPPEVYSKVLSHCSMADWMRCAVVSKQFSQLVQSYLLRRIHHAQSAHNTDKLPSLVDLFKARPTVASFVQALHIETTQAGIATELFEAIPSNNNISSLVFKIPVVMDTTQRTTEPLHSATRAAHFFNLIEFDFAGPSALRAVAECVISQAPQLKDLQLEGTSFHALHLDETCVIPLEQLVRLKLQNVHQATISGLLGSCAGNLRAIDLQDSPATFSLPSQTMHNLREVRWEEDCAIFIAATPILQRLFIYQDHFPLLYFTRYSTTCMHITHLHLLDTPYANYDTIRKEIYSIFEHISLPTLQAIEFGTWITLLYLLPVLPPSVSHLDLHEMDFRHCPSLINLIVNEFPIYLSKPISCFVHIENEGSTIAKSVVFTGKDMAKWINCQIRYKNEILWRSSGDKDRQEDFANSDI